MLVLLVSISMSLSNERNLLGLEIKRKRKSVKTNTKNISNMFCDGEPV